MGLFSSMTGMVSALAGMGIATSAVRTIAEATGSGDHVQLARTTTALRRILWRLGVVDPSCSRRSAFR